MTSPFSLLVVVVALVVVGETIKMSPMLEKCGEQMLMTLAKEQNKELKKTMNKAIKQMQTGDMKGAQDGIKSMGPDNLKYLQDKYLTNDCGPLKPCFDCPIEL